ncbi:MAG: PEP-CTERM sorting domain-containing protein [Gammaproteobacteria bacterium]|nr:PEP-CTERM sorting domain-containing protein [Gammaproteobacteria bacterium]
MISKAVVVALAMTASGVVMANPVAGNTCGAPDRIATLVDAAQCAYGSSANPDASLVGSIYGDTWTKAGELTGNGTNGYFTATGNNWGSIPASGTWAIDPSFWNHFTKGAISMHVGQGGGDPDYWVWLLKDDSTSGTWDLAKLQKSGGGGLSNIKLWGVVGEREVPAPGVLALLGVGLFGLVVARRRKA